jgi:hypothetical protein
MKLNMLSATAYGSCAQAYIRFFRVPMQLQRYENILKADTFWWLSSEGTAESSAPFHNTQRVILCVAIIELKSYRL